MTAGSDGGKHWTYEQWVERTTEKIIQVSRTIPEEHRADWLKLQIGLAIDQALRHGRSGRANNEPVVR